jgi:hypothetical protein
LVAEAAVEALLAIMEVLAAIQLLERLRLVVVALDNMRVLVDKAVRLQILIAV